MSLEAGESDYFLIAFLFVCLQSVCSPNLNIMRSQDWKQGFWNLISTASVDTFMQPEVAWVFWRGWSGKPGESIFYQDGLSGLQVDSHASTARPASLNAVSHVPRAEDAGST